MTNNLDPEHLRKYINRNYQYEPLTIGYLITFFFFLDGFFAFGFIFPYPDWLLSVLTPCVAFVNILGVALMLAPYRLQKHIWLFFSLYSLFTSVSFYLLITEGTVKLINSENMAFAYRVMMYGAYLVWNVVLWRWHLEHFRNGWHQLLDPKPPRMIEQFNQAKIAVLTVCGVHVLIGWLAGAFWYGFEFGILIIGSAGLAFVVPNLHRYVTILRHPELYYNHQKGAFPPHDHATHPPGTGN